MIIFALKAGRDWDGLRVNKPTEYVVIRKCIARRGAGLVTLGSETSGSIRHIYCTDLFAKHTDNGLRIKSATTRGGTVEDVYFVELNFRFNSYCLPVQFELVPCIQLQ
jgi:polygalacturonase